MVQTQDAYLPSDVNVGLLLGVKSQYAHLPSDVNVGILLGAKLQSVYLPSDLDVGVFVLPTSPTYKDQVFSDAALGYWPLDEISGTVAIDATGYNRHGNYMGGYTLGGSNAIPGELHTTFNGTSGYVHIPTFPDMNAFTIEAMILVTAGSLGVARGVFSERYGGSGSVRNQFALPAATGTFGRLGYAWYQDGWGWQGLTQEAIAFPEASLQHIVASYNPTGPVTKIFRNGVKVAELTGGNVNPLGVMNNGYYIGADHNPGSFFSGAMAHVSVYGTALSEARIADHYASRPGAATKKGINTMLLRRFRGI